VNQPTADRPTPLLATDAELTRNSYYAATVQRGAGHPPLNGSTDCDVAIVGGGLAGLSAALELRQRGLDVVLLEARQIGFGASGRNGGQAIHGLACDQATIEKQLGLDDARRVWAMTIEALDLIRERIARHEIECDWRDGYLGLATSARKAAELAAWADRIETVYGYRLQRVDPTALPQWIASPRFHSGIHDARSGHLHPLKYTLGLARAAARAGARLHENTPVQALRDGPRPTLITATGEVRARQVLLAGNVYLNGLAPSLAPRIMPVGTYIACSEALAPARADALIPSRSAVCDTNFVLDYFRTTDDHRMLYGGRVSYSTRTPADLAESMRRRMVQTFPQLAGVKVEYAWGGFVDISMNRAPDFGRLPANPNVYYLQGFSGHGLALTGLAGRLVAEAMSGDASRFDVFARLRHRSFPGGALLRTPALVLGMAWYRLRDMLG
jgi:gamma-glutamylputrescine oxidase